MGLGTKLRTLDPRQVLCFLFNLTGITLLPRRPQAGYCVFAWCFPHERVQAVHAFSTVSQSGCVPDSAVPLLGWLQCQCLTDLCTLIVNFSVCLETSPTTQRMKRMLCKCGDQSEKPHKADAVACTCPCSAHIWEETELPEALWASQPAGHPGMNKTLPHTGRRQGFTPKVVLWLPQVCFNTRAHIYHTHTHKIKIIFFLFVFH